MIHTIPGSANMWSIGKEEFMERMTESAKATVDHFAGHITFVNVLRNMSVSCDCEGVGAAPVVTPNIGIVASLDILAADQASVDLVYALKPQEHHDLVERMESRHGLRQLTYMKELGMGNDRYALLDIDNGDAHIDPGSVKYFSQKSLRGLARTKSASNGGVLRGDLQVLHVHVLLVAPLSTSYMTQSGTD